MQNNHRDLTIHSGPQDTVYVYWVALGVYGLITLNNRQFVWAEQLTPFLEQLREDKRFRKVMIFVYGAFPFFFFRYTIVKLFLND